MAHVTYDVTSIDSNPRHTLGAIYWQEGKAYKYVKFLDAVTYAAGHVCVWADAAGTSVTNDKSGGSALVNDINVAGIALAAMTQNSYGFIQVAGVAEVLGDGSVAAGDFVVSHSADGQADTMADGEEEQVFGIALEADDATTSIFTCALKGLI